MDQLEGVDKTSTQLKSDDSVAAPVKTEPAKDGGKVEHKTFKSALRANLGAEKEAKQPEAKKLSEPVVTEVKAAPTPIVEPILAPSDMTAEEKAAFSNPTAENVALLQKYLSRRSYEYQSDHTKKIGELNQKAKEIDDINTIINPEREYYAKKKLPVATIVANAIAWDKALENNRIGAAKEWLESYGIDPRELIAENASQENTASPQPQYLTREQAETLAEQKARAAIQAEFNTREQSRIAEQEARVVMEFIETDPLFRDPGTGAQLEAAMAPVVAGLRSANPGTPVREILETARRYVVSGNPTFSELVSKLAAKQDMEKKNADAQKAMQASLSISGGPGQGTPKIKAKNFREGVRMRLNGAA